MNYRFNFHEFSKFSEFVARICNLLVALICNLLVVLICNLQVAFFYTSLYSPIKMEKAQYYLKKIFSETRNPEIKKIITQISPQEILGFTWPETQKYIKSKFAPELENPYNYRGLENNENPNKYDAFTDRVSVQSKTDETPMQSVLKNMKNIPQYDTLNLARHFILLDSRNRNLSTNEYSWNLTPFNNTQQGQINTRDSIKQIIEIVCYEFRIPFINSFYESVRIGIREFTQGAEINTVNKYSTQKTFHFEFSARRDGDFTILTPKNTSWRPDKPIAQCDNLTICFYNNSEKITFAADRMRCAITIGAPAIFTCPEPHGGVTGDLIYVNDGHLYNDAGYTIAVLSPTTFLISATATIAESVEIYFAKQRVQIPMHFVCLER